MKHESSIDPNFTPTRIFEKFKIPQDQKDQWNFETYSYDPPVKLDVGIKRSENVIMFDCAGFSKDEIEITHKNKKIFVKCNSNNYDILTSWKSSVKYEYACTNEIEFAEYINGILYVHLKQETETTKKIEIRGD